MNRSIYTLGFATAFASLLAVGCGDDSGGAGDTSETGSTTDDSAGTTTDDSAGSTTDDTSDETTEDASEETTAADSTGVAARTVTWDISGLEDLGPDYVYEGWLIVDDAPVTAGRFSVVDGTADLLSFEITDEQADGATKYVLTIEPAEGDDPAPSATHLVAGDFVDGVADLGVADPAALGTDFAEAAGSFILETPSSGDVMDDYHQGIWWLDPMAGPGAAFSLPELPEGWAYEGWVVTDNGPISTGRFTAADTADSDAGGPDAGPDMTPPFPGQDFIDPALSLIGATAVLSVEPEPDNGPAPFLLKPLVFMDIADVPPPGLQAMTNNAAETNPTGTATIE